MCWKKKSHLSNYLTRIGKRRFQQLHIIRHKKGNISIETLLTNHYNSNLEFFFDFMEEFPLRTTRRQHAATLRAHYCSG